MKTHVFLPIFTNCKEKNDFKYNMKLFYSNLKNVKIVYRQRLIQFSKKVIK